jgi:membrane associated rhomboid family serine protease
VAKKAAGPYAPLMTDAPQTPPRPRPIEARDAQTTERLVPPDWLARAPVTRALIALNVAVFAVQLVITRFTSLMRFPTHEELAFGASYSLATIGESRWETLVTACFLHGGLLHLGFNMLALWQAGPLVERAVGSARMAPMYLVAGASGNLLSVAEAWLTRTAQLVVGASGAISGVVAAALVVGWRVQGWRGPLTQAMARWLVLILAFGVFANINGGNISNAAHAGGAIAGAAIAATWRRGYRYSTSATSAILSACTIVVVGCIAAVAARDRTDPFATMTLQERSEFTHEALAEGRCNDAWDGLRAVERLRAKMAPVTSLRNQVQAVCP